MQETLRQFKADIFQALAHPTRIAVNEQLRDGELSAGVIIDRLGLEQANASQHFAVLRTRNIRPIGIAGHSRVYNEEAIDRIAEELRAIDARKDGAE